MSNKTIFAAWTYKVSSMKQILYIIIFLFSINISAQEICNNGIDDDGDTFIDLNDTVDCNCITGTPINSVASLIPNPSFEARTCCPTTYGNFNCVSSWSASATPDYFNKCNYVSTALTTASLTTFPDGLGCAGVLFNSDYKEYISSCLTSPMLAGNEYRLKFNVASLLINPYMNNCSSGFNNNLGPVYLTIYGKADCTNLAATSGPTVNCISAVDTAWKVLGSVNYSPLANWDLIAITFTPSTNINAIALGSPCSLPAAYPPFSTNSSSCHPYFLFDNLTLNNSNTVGLIDILSTGHYCTDNLALKANVVSNISSGSSIQWYHNGVALIGATSSTYSVAAGVAGLGNYQVMLNNTGFCALSGIYEVTATPPTIAVNSKTICLSSSAILTATSSVVNTFTWSTGAVSNTLTVNPNTTTIYTVSGTYGSCIAEATPTVTVRFGTSNPLIINATTLTTCPGTTVGLTGYNADSYGWSDGGIGTIVGGAWVQSTIVKPYSNTTYTLTGTFQGPFCTAKSLITINMLPAPSISITPNNIKICPGSTRTLTAMGSSNYTWSTGSNSNTITVSPTVNTTYTVTSTNGTCSTSTTSLIKTDSTFNITSGSRSLCRGNTATLTAIGANTYTWNNGSNLNYQIVTPTITTTYSVMGSIGNCTAQASPTVTVFDPSLFSITANTLICAGKSSTISAITSSLATTAYHYYLTYPSTPFASTIAVSPTTTTNYTVTNSLMGGGCNATSIITVSVIPKPIINVSPNNISICSGGNVNLTATGVSNYTWSTGSTSSSISVSPTSNTTFTVSGTDGICTASTTAMVSVVFNPTVSVNSPTICLNQSSVLLATGATNYTWSTGETTNSVSVSPINTSTYSVVGSVVGCPSNATETSTVFVNPLPNVSFSAISILCINSNPVILSGSPANGVFTGTGIVSNSSFDPSISGVGIFPISYYYIDINGCSNTATQTVTVDYCTGEMELKKSTILIFPNPTNSSIIVSSEQGFEKIKILNSIGQTIISFENSTNLISVSNLSDGIYFIQIIDKKGTILKTEKFIKN